MPVKLLYLPNSHPFRPLKGKPGQNSQGTAYINLLTHLVFGPGFPLGDGRGKGTLGQCITYNNKLKRKQHYKNQNKIANIAYFKYI